MRSLESRILSSRSLRTENSGPLVSSPVLTAFFSLTQASALSPVTSSSHWNWSLGSSAFTAKATNIIAHKGTNSRMGISKVEEGQEAQQIETSSLAQVKYLRVSAVGNFSVDCQLSIAICN